MSATAPHEQTEAPLPRWLVVLGVALFCGCAALAALLEVLLVTWHIGSWSAPISILAAVAGNILLPVLAWRFAGSVAAAALPVVVWLVVVIVLSMGRPEGDVLLPGGGSDAIVSYGTLLGGMGAGVATIAVLAARNTRRINTAPQSGAAGSSGPRRTVSRGQ